MTAGAFLLSLSSLSTGTAIEHIMSIATGGSITWLPAQNIGADMSQMTLTADLLAQSINANIEIQSFNANLLSDEYSATIIQNNIQGDLSCK